MAGDFIPVERPPGSVDIEDFARADYALEQALDYGRLDPLIERLRSTAFLLPEERSLAADILAGVWKQPPHRRAEDPRVLRNREHYLALSVWALRVAGVSHERAVFQVVNDEKVSESKVRKAVRVNDSLFGPLLRNRRSGKKVST